MYMYVYIYIYICIYIASEIEQTHQAETHQAKSGARMGYSIT